VTAYKVEKRIDELVQTAGVSQDQLEIWADRSNALGWLLDENVLEWPENKRKRSPQLCVVLVSVVNGLILTVRTV
jgi:hypothetical protein